MWSRWNSTSRTGRRGGIVSTLDPHQKKKSSAQRVLTRPCCRAPALSRWIQSFRTSRFFTRRSLRRVHQCIEAPKGSTSVSVKVSWTGDHE